MHHGQLVRSRDRYGKRLCIALHATKAYMVKNRRKGLNWRRPGVYLFRGLWYGSDPFNIDCYGKIEGRCGVPVGRVRNLSQLRKLRI